MLRLATTTLAFMSMATLGSSSSPENHKQNVADAAIRVHRHPNHRHRRLTNEQHDLWYSRHSATTKTGNGMHSPLRSLQQQRIFGGRDAKAGEYAYYVHGIDEELCGGSLIAPDIVLSAAHCEKAFTGKTVTVGSKDLLGNDKNAEVLDIDFRNPHPDYTPGPEDNDIMLIKLKKPAKQASVVTLNTDLDEPSTDQPVIVIGFGITDWTGTVSETLQEVEVQTLTWQDCSQILPDIQEFHVCAGLPQGGKDSCAGDSGGPLVDASNKNLQYGLISFGYGCAEPNSPGVYTSVAYYNDWISDFVCAESDDPPEQFNCRGRQAGGGDSGNNENENATSSPTASPSTTAATQSPTLAPTHSPTTVAPVTLMPSLEPTMIASDTPTTMPSLRPSVSGQPSYIPSDRPSDIPSNFPSDFPSDVPTLVPTASLTTAEQVEEVEEKTPVNDDEEEELESQLQESDLVQERDGDRTAVPFTSSATNSATAAASMSSKTAMTVVTFLLGCVAMMMQ